MVGYEFFPGTAKARTLEHATRRVPPYGSERAITTRKLLLKALTDRQIFRSPAGPPRGQTRCRIYRPRAGGWWHSPADLGCVVWGRSLDSPAAAHASSGYGHVMPAEPMIIPPLSPGADGVVVKGSQLVIGDWSACGTATEVAPLHVHHRDDEAWHVISGALRFRFEDREVDVDEGSSVLVPAGVAHTFGNAGPSPSRFIIILPKRLDELISRLHDSDPSEHMAIYERYASQLLE